MAKDKQERPQHEHVQRKASSESSHGASESDSDIGAAARDSLIQRLELGGGGASAIDTNAVHEAAADGVASATTSLPHADAIQASFGPDHDVSQINAHVGGNNAAAMGAMAYASGDHVVFDQAPDLHTAAHEVAHVVQQAKGVNLYGGVGEAGDSYEREADAIADRVVAGTSAADLLGGPTHGGAPGAAAVQHKPSPTQSNADQHVIHAIQSHVKLTSARINAAAAQITSLLQMSTAGDAGSEPMMQMIEAQIDMVNGDLDSLNAEITKVPEVLRGTLNAELATIRGAFHSTWAPALNRVYSFTHDNATGNQKGFAQGHRLGITATQDRMNATFQYAGVDQNDVGATAAPRITQENQAHPEQQRDEELAAAEKEAVVDGMSSVESALELVKADLHSSSQDLTKQATDLTVSVSQLVAVLEPINPDHIGKVSKLPGLIKQVEALQADVMNMKDEEKGKKLAKTLGYNTQLSSNLHTLKTKITSLNNAHKGGHRH